MISRLIINELIRVFYFHITQRQEMELKWQIA